MSPVSDTDRKAVTFESIEPQEIEIEEGGPSKTELAKYLCRRRETIAVSHITPDIRTSGLSNHAYISAQNKIPEISICRSPSPPCLSDSGQLQYKEQYLPRPAVLQVRPQFDRRASDSVTLQDSIAQYNLLHSRHHYQTGNGSGNNLLNVPETENAGSESDSEDIETVNKNNYLMSIQRRGRVFEPSLENDSPPSVKPFSHAPKPRPSRERERASPVPYLPVSPVSRISNERRPSDVEKKKDESESMIKQLFQEHKRLRDQFGDNTVEHGNRTTRRASQNQNLFRYSYPLYQEDTSADKIPCTLPPPESEHNSENPSLALLQQKQEAQWQNLYVQHLVQRKILESQMEQERRELFRRASEGTPRLENSILEFLTRREESARSSPNVDTPHKATELQDEMKKLNLQVLSPESLFNERSIVAGSSDNTSELSYSPLSTGSMDIDQQEVDSQYRYANMQSLFNSHSGPSHNRQRRLNFMPLPAGLGSPYGPITNATHSSEVESSHLHNEETVWPAVNSEIIDGPVSSGNSHKMLSGTLSVDVSSSLDISEVVISVKRCLDERPDINYEQSDKYFSLYKDGVHMEIEVYPLARTSSMNGVKLRRVDGDKWSYKKIRDDILSALHL